MAEFAVEFDKTVAPGSPVRRGKFQTAYGADIKYESPDMIQDFVCFPIPKTNACNYKFNFK